MDMQLLLSRRDIQRKIIMVGGTTLARWRRENHFPAPDVEINGKYFWLKSTVGRWIEERLRLKSRSPEVANLLGLPTNYAQPLPAPAGPRLGGPAAEGGSES